MSAALPAFTMDAKAFAKINLRNDLLKSRRAGFCCARVSGFFSGHQCQRKAKLTVNNVPFCKQHNPIEIKRRHDEREARWKREWDADERRRAFNEALGSAQDKVLDLAKKVFRQKTSFEELERAVRELETLEAKRPAATTT